MKGQRLNVTIEEQREQGKGNQRGWIEFCAPRQNAGYSVNLHPYRCACAPCHVGVVVHLQRCSSSPLYRVYAMHLLSMVHFYTHGCAIRSTPKGAKMHLYG